MKKRIKNAILGEGVSLISCFSTDETFGTEYDIHLLCAMKADHVTLPTTFLALFCMLLLLVAIVKIKSNR